MGTDKRTVATDALDTLGTIIDDKQKRDAIHLAVEPVVAGVQLRPGQHITVKNGTAIPSGYGKGLGIVDPFLTNSVEPGQRFWFVMYPRQVHSLRHVWTHPDFPSEEVEVAKEPSESQRKESEEWLRWFCENSDCPSYDTVMKAATGVEIPNTDKDYYEHAYTNDGEYLHFNGYDAHSDIPAEFWDHVEVVSGKKIPQEKRATSFSCSC